MNNKAFYFLLTSMIFSVSVAAQSNIKYILNENFDSNKLGWVEESTDAHNTEIKNGSYYIHSIDTSKDQSSAGPQNISFLWGLPAKYEISSSFRSMDRPDVTVFGIILSSSTLEYKFSFSDKNRGTLKEWDYNRNTDSLMFAKKRNTEINLTRGPVEFRITVDHSRFEYFINGELMGTGIFRTKSWDGIRLFTSSGSAVDIDYLRIKEVK